MFTLIRKILITQCMFDQKIKLLNACNGTLILNAIYWDDIRLYGVCKLWIEFGLHIINCPHRKINKTPH